MTLAKRSQVEDEDGAIENKKETMNQSSLDFSTSELLVLFLGPRGPLRTASFVRPSVRSPVRAKNLNHV